MLTIRKHTDVAVPPAEVFAYMEDPSHQTDITPNLARAELIEHLENGGSRVQYTYRVLGVSFSGEAQTMDYLPEERIVWSVTGDLQGTLRWYFTPLSRHSKTRFTYALTVRIPGPAFLRPFLPLLARRHSERVVQTLLRRLSMQLEHEPSPMSIFSE